MPLTSEKRQQTMVISINDCEYSCNGHNVYECVFIYITCVSNMGISGSMELLKCIYDYVLREDVPTWRPYEYALW